MNITDKNIDGGRPFDWGRISSDYAKWRDIYPPDFYEKIISRGLCVKPQRVLDLGTGTGVLPRNLYRYGADWIGVDISENQIAEAKHLSAGMDISYITSPTEKIDFPDGTFDIVTACQCFWYFDHPRVEPILGRILKSRGRILILYMAWLPFEDRIAGASEELVLKYSPGWSGGRETLHPIAIPDCYFRDFRLTWHDEFRLNVHFTRESWNGRMKACRGVGASLEPEKLREWESEHLALLETIAPDEFNVLHYAAMTGLEKI